MLNFSLHRAIFYTGFGAWRGLGMKKRHLGETKKWKKKYENEIVKEKIKGPQVMILHADVAFLIPKISNIKFAM